MSSPSYSSYLDIEALLRLPRPRTGVADEYLFIVTHQALELWFAEALHEIDQVTRDLNADRIAAAGRKMRRLHRIVELWTAHLDVLDTMPATEFAAFRGALGTASGFQSVQFRELELASGAAERDVLRIARAAGSAGDRLRARRLTPSLRQAFGHFLARANITVHQVYAGQTVDPAVRAFAEELIEYDIAFNRWRYRHYLLVVHAIGAEAGTGGSTGARYLRDTTTKWFFPEIWSARSMGEKVLSTPVPLTVPLDGSVSADRSLLGGKAWGLQQMHQLGIPVPPAFTITTEGCSRYFERGNELPAQLWDEILDQLRMLERRAGARFGGTPPLTVSVRSGAPVSMPGMMDTLLNVGRTGSPSARYALRSAISQIFDSWNNERARAYRAANGIPDGLGTAVTVQAMVFGNRDERSGTGVYVTRNPLTGEPEPYGEWLAQAQGEELVAGGRTPEQLTALRATLPEVYEELIAHGQRLEHTQRNVLEIEFTVESGTLYLLQVRNSSSSPEAAARWAVDMVRAGVIDIEEALARVPPRSAPAEQVAAGGPPLATGIGVSAGVRAGLVVTSADEAADVAEEGRPVLLARSTTSTHDIQGFLAADGVITEHGGSTSHAAVVARQLGLPCVVGCGDGTVDAVRGKVVTIDGNAGHVYDGDVTVTREQVADDGPFAVLARWRSEAAPDKH